MPDGLRPPTASNTRNGLLIGLGIWVALGLIARIVGA